MARTVALPPPRERKSERIAIFLQPSVWKRVKELAAARGEPAGRVAGVLLEAALVAHETPSAEGA